MKVFKGILLLKMFAESSIIDVRQTLNSFMTEDWFLYDRDLRHERVK